MNVLNRIEDIFKTNDMESVDSFERVTLRLSGMRFTQEYEILMKEEEAEVSQYEIRYGKEEDERILDRQVSCDKDTILKLFSDCELLSWDGFVGKHPKGVSDGIMFTLEAILNDKGSMLMARKTSPNITINSLMDCARSLMSPNDKEPLRGF